jgi:hypothetical protein
VKLIRRKYISINEVISLSYNMYFVQFGQGRLTGRDNELLQRDSNIKIFLTLTKADYFNIVKSFAGGELGPTLKLKRFYFNKKYSEAIENLYT